MNVQPRALGSAASAAAEGGVLLSKKYRIFLNLRSVCREVEFDTKRFIWLHLWVLCPEHGFGRRSSVWTHPAVATPDGWWPRDRASPEILQNPWVLLSDLKPKQSNLLQRA